MRFKFDHDSEIDARREELKRNYDEAFEKVLRAPKGSEEHKEALRLEASANKKTVSFLQANLRYFTELKKFYMRYGNINMRQILPLDLEEKKIFSEEYEPRFKGEIVGDYNRRPNYGRYISDTQGTKEDDKQRSGDTARKVEDSEVVSEA